MALQIRVSPDALRDAAGQIRSLDMGISNHLKSVSNMVDAAWDGLASRQMISTIDELIGSARTIENNLAESSNGLESIANMFESLDIEAGVTAIAMRIDFSSKLLKMMPFLPIINWKELFFGQIRIVPEEIRAAANECAEVGNALRDTGERFYSIARGLESTWEGNAFNRFLDNSAELHGGMIQLSDSIEQISNKLMNAANLYEEADNSISF